MYPCMRTTRPSRRSTREAVSTTSSRPVLRPRWYSRWKTTTRSPASINLSGSNPLPVPCVRLALVQPGDLARAMHHGAFLDAADRSVLRDARIEQLRQHVPAPTVHTLVDLPHDLDVSFSHRCCAVSRARAIATAAPPLPGDWDALRACRPHHSPEAPCGRCSVCVAVGGGQQRRVELMTPLRHRPGSISRGVYQRRLACRFCHATIAEGGRARCDEEPALKRVWLPGGKPTGRPREAGEEKCAGERLDCCAVAVRAWRDTEDRKPIGDVEGGIETQLAFHRGSMRASLVHIAELLRTQFAEALASGRDGLWALREESALRVGHRRSSPGRTQATGHRPAPCEPRLTLNRGRATARSDASGGACDAERVGADRLRRTLLVEDVELADRESRALQEVDRSGG